LKRRDFLKTTTTATAAAALTSSLSAAGHSDAPREYYELHCDHLKTGSRLKGNADPALLDNYLKDPFLPVVRDLGLKNTGVFTELEVDKKAGTSKPISNSPVWVLMTYPTLDSFVRVSASLNANSKIQKARVAYLQVPQRAPAFERVDSWLLLAFAGMPQMEIPAFSRDRIPTRVFEMRDYESHSEAKALVKMAMFDEGETELMRELGMNPVAYGQALSGPNLPHLRYFTSGPDLESHLANWGKFGPSAGWQKMKSDPKWADSTSRNTARFLAPKPYSEL